MEFVFTRQDTDRARGAKKKLLLIWFVLLGVYLAAVLSMAIVNFYRVSLYYDRSLRGLFTVLSTILTVLFAVYSFFFFSLKFRLTNNYVKLFEGIDEGEKLEDIVTFVEFDYSFVSKDGVDFYTMIAKAKPLKRIDITERNILVSRLHNLDFQEGDRIRVVTYGNILTAYEKIEGDL